jgi:hypothetical protein
MSFNAIQTNVNIQSDITKSLGDYYGDFVRRDFVNCVAYLKADPFAVVERFMEDYGHCDRGIAEHARIAFQDGLFNLPCADLYAYANHFGRIIVLRSKLAGFSDLTGASWKKGTQFSLSGQDGSLWKRNAKGRWAYEPMHRLGANSKINPEWFTLVIGERTVDRTAFTKEN